MPAEPRFPWRRSLLLRLLALSALVSICSIAATAWLSARTTTGAIRQEQGRALVDDARIYDALLGYAATHPDWHGVGDTVRDLAEQTGRRITLTGHDRTPIADSTTGGATGSGATGSDAVTADPLPANASATIDPLAVDAAFAPYAAADRVDPRAVGPFLLPQDERARLRTLADRSAVCLRQRMGVDAGLVERPSGRPDVEASGTDLAASIACLSVRADLAVPTPTESKALGQLNALLNTCLVRRGVPAVRLNLDQTWNWLPAASETDDHVAVSGDRAADGGDRAAGAAPGPRGGAESAPVPPDGESVRSNPDDNRSVGECLGSSRREQLTPYVAPAALLFVTTPGNEAPTGFDLSPANRARIAGVTGLVLLVTVSVTVLAGVRMVRPLRALIGAAQRMRDGDGSARVKVTGGDEIARLAMVFNDMSARRERLEELRRAMVSDVAHEMRTPVSNIRGWLEAAEDGVVAPDRKLMSSLLEEAMLLQHVIDDLQDLAAADAGELRLHHQQVYVADLLSQVLSANQARADRAGVTLTSRVEADPEVYADPVRLRQAVGNLVTNAVRHTPAGGTVTIRAGTDADGLRIAVSDTGSGIAEDDLPRVFERFWRAEKSRNRQTGGSGLGLPIVRKLVEAHGGTVSATSVLGRGSVFTLLLPADRAAARTGAAPG
ncbi:ATP-binding protein [Micromonospora sp. NPDC050397]|uniref:HAMP domain-containing sensor histidine kinase n=1 Tax=Micromonospora sp. NPDC050397 TaxID=3364279 RepID=UPI00384E65B8